LSCLLALSVATGDGKCNPDRGRLGAMKELSVYFFGKPGSPKDEMVHSIFKIHGGVFRGCGTLLGRAAPERDVHYEVPENRLEACRAALKEVGVRMKPGLWH
jgi:hypothetical protein